MDALVDLLEDDTASTEVRLSSLRSLRSLATSDATLQWKLIALERDVPELKEAISVAYTILPPSDGELQRREEEMRNAAIDEDAAFTGDAFQGERVFFHSMGPGCYRCHTVDGRGGSIGPDLSNIGRGMSREKLIDSILNPSREVAPQYTNWQMATVDGALHSGMIVLENEGKTAIGTAEGEIIELQTIEIEQRAPQSISVMPERLEGRMTRQEFLDLLAFLHALRGD